ncbi:hypothetical protein DICVIV_12431 [Dictyocaulus viviparus]|uniref:Uncharacterized protein n=1 Tax=Dictyocaulus viviparus TaxID=29172 RepID=A0A0D8XAG6_DICVI|nr:hypothetical protein DICVIV_12431 [Dictyocaulus viviparus]
MSFPDSIRLDPIRLPRPTLRETSIYNISNYQYMSNLLPPKDMSIMPMALRYDPLAFPEHLRARRLGDINMSVADDKPSFHAVSSVSATDMNNMPANDWNPLSDSEARDDNSHNTSQYEESPLPQPTQQFQSHSMLMMSSALNNNFVMSKFLGYQRFIFILTKYPALVMAMVALWYTTGRGEGMPKSTAETSYLYHVTMVAAFCTAVTCIVFAVINIDLPSVANI